MIRNGSNKIVKWKYHLRCGEVTDVYNTGKGYAFVTFDEKEAAENAIREMDGATVNGQQIKVNEAKPREGGRGGGRGGYGGGFGGGRGGGGNLGKNVNKV